MGIQTTTYKKRLRANSGLSPLARLVAQTIADLRYEARKRHDEPLSLTLVDLADECGMSRRAIVRYLNECLTSGWVVGRSIYRDGRQKPNEYFIVDPSDEAECTRVHSVIASGGQILSARVAHNCDTRLHTVLRSKNNGAADDAALRGGGGSDEQGRESDGRQPQPSPALGGAEADSGGMVGETRNPQLEEQPPDDPAPTDAAVFAGWDSDDQAADVAELAGGLVRRERNPLALSNQPPPSGACHHCGRTRPVPSGNPRLWECAHCGRYWLATPTKPRLALA